MRAHHFSLACKFSSTHTFAPSLTRIFHGMALRKLQKELAAFQQSADTTVSAQPASDANLFKWKASIVGPAGSPYAGGRFFLDVDVPADYPFAPPKVTFATKVYHPNVNDNGGICLDVLKPEHWAPAMTINQVLLAVQALLATPTADSPIVPEAAELLKSDRAAFDRKAAEWTQKYAM